MGVLRGWQQFGNFRSPEVYFYLAHICQISGAESKSKEPQSSTLALAVILRQLGDSTLLEKRDLPETHGRLLRKIFATFGHEVRWKAQEHSVKLKDRGPRHTQASQLKASEAIPEEEEPEIEYAL